MQNQYLYQDQDYEVKELEIEEIELADLAELADLDDYLFELELDALDLDLFEFSLPRGAREQFNDSLFYDWD